MKHQIKLHPYKVSTCQKLYQRDIDRRVQFCRLMTQKFDEGVLAPDKIVFTDECWFHIDGFVNKQNFRFWAKENPHYVISKTKNPIKVMVWAAISTRGVFYTFIDGTLNSATYKELLEKKWYPFAENSDVIKEYWFMQDGAAPHRTQTVFESLYSKYGVRVIGLGYVKFAGGGVEWPSNSPDLNPCDFFLWGYLKEKVFAENPKTLEELKKAITKAVNRLNNEDKHMLESVFRGFKNRLEYCSLAEGNHFENIYC